MYKKRIDYAIIIVNYNSAQDTLLAIKSIEANTAKDYCICVVDNLSSNADDVNYLRENIQKYKNCLFYVAPRNGGYAYGNNYGVKQVLEQYDVDFIVIMNPDVEIPEFGVIDKLVDKLNDLSTQYAGVQPWHYVPHEKDTPPNMYKAFRKVFNYTDVVCTHLKLLRPLFRRRVRDLVYEEERPYNEEMDFEVPSGAFFVIKTDSFCDVGMFDERTFLYAEEYILGYKIKEKGLKFRLIPDLYIIHEGGKSTGFIYSSPKWKMIKYSMQAMEVYLKYYLHCNHIQILIVKFLKIYNYILKSAYVIILKILKK